MTQSVEIPTTPEQLQKIRLLSDGELYQMACQFIENNQTIEAKKQAVSLVAHTQDWDDLTRFVKHQRQRDWGTGDKSYYASFFSALEVRLHDLRRRVEGEWFLPGPDYETKKQRKIWADHFAILVAREFLQHLEAENMYKAIDQR